MYLWNTSSSTSSTKALAAVTSCWNFSLSPTVVLSKTFRVTLTHTSRSRSCPSPRLGGGTQIKCPSESESLSCNKRLLLPSTHPTLVSPSIVRCPNAAVSPLALGLQHTHPFTQNSQKRIHRPLTSSSIQKIQSSYTILPLTHPPTTENLTVVVSCLRRSLRSPKPDNAANKE
jgi:hypothetical protein